MILVKKLENRIEISLFDIVHLIIPKEMANILSIDNICPWVLRSCLYSFKCCIRLKVKLSSKLLPLLFHDCFVFRNCFQVQI